ncbi:hypothetical protein [Nitrosopumilus ureiphilus]|uniref:Uncharacterized protein n=1 Tax=Nitrosopumilus ureiphilus TaxID=1470067 RepID=A0A7D5M4P5_9ARCH|nr:hypothetical protein [Nitrosopumilus ureiphilus]QLH06652.1 hypothetical protein C5F50_05870 [Nitrosopumilus ureiphilus]
MKYFVIFLVLMMFVGTIAPVLGFEIHDLDYENSPYQNKKTPSLGKPVELFYQVVNHAPKNQSYDVMISITNLDEKKQVHSKQYQYEIPSGKFIDIIWKFTPETSGLYLVDVTENHYKYTKHIFAVPENNDFKKIHKTNPVLLENQSPRQQFRMGIDPKEIFCKDELYLALKSSGLPVCVTLDTLIEFRQRDIIIPDVIDYDRIGFAVSENQFIKMLDENNIEYDREELLLVSGFAQLSLPPTSGYCGYVLDKTPEDYWFSSSYHFDTLLSSNLYDENPNPCISAMSFTCECSIQTQLKENELTELSYFDESQEKHVGNMFRDYLNEGGKIANAPNSFIIGKYNMDLDSDITLFCGQFQGKQYWHFTGSINDTKISDWGRIGWTTQTMCNK